jgi:integrase
VIGFGGRQRARIRRQPGDADDTRPVTVDEALNRYEADLKARGGSLYNATRVRVHLTPSLAGKPVALLTAAELKRWRDGLVDKGLTAASVNRTRVGLRAALELAAGVDPRIGNARAFKLGLKGLPDAARARNVILDDASVRRLIQAAYDQNRQFGLLIEVLATTGARASQVERLEVADLQADRLRLMMPLSGKGNLAKRRERRPVPIGEGLAALLTEETAGRALDAPLLGPVHYGAFRAAFATAAAAAGLEAGDVTPYALRHSSIVRQLLSGAASHCRGGAVAAVLRSPIALSALDTPHDLNQRCPDKFLKLHGTPPSHSGGPGVWVAVANYGRP